MISKLWIVPAPNGQSTEPSSLRRLVDEVHRLLRIWQTPRHRMERRSQQRYPLSQLILITPVGKDDVILGPPVVGCCKDLSVRGIGFYHPHPLPFRKAIITFDSRTQEDLSVLTVLGWCRFTRRGWYESGGRFVQAVPTPQCARDPQVLHPE